MLKIELEISEEGLEVEMTVSDVETEIFDKEHCKVLNDLLNTATRQFMEEKIDEMKKEEVDGYIELVD